MGLTLADYRRALHRCAENVELGTPESRPIWLALAQSYRLLIRHQEQLEWMGRSLEPEEAATASFLHDNGIEP